MRQRCCCLYYSNALSLQLTDEGWGGGFRHTERNGSLPLKSKYAKQRVRGEAGMYRRVKNVRGTVEL